MDRIHGPGKANTTPKINIKQPTKTQRHPKLAISPVNNQYMNGRTITSQIPKAKGKLVRFFAILFFNEININIYSRSPRTPARILPIPPPNPKIRMNNVAYF